MKKCNMCGTTTPDDNQRFCPNCGSEMVNVETSTANIKKDKKEKADKEASLVGDKNLINDSTIIGKQEKYEASNITINNTITEDHSLTTVVCAVSGKRVYMDSSIVCPQCGQPVAPEYYVEANKRCENCEHKAEKAFRDFATQHLQGKSLNAEVKALLDSKGAELLLTPAKQTEILRSLQNSSAVKDGALSKMQQMDLERAIKHLVQLNSKEECASALKMFELLHKTTQNYVADFWYYLTCALTNAEQYINNFEGEVVENFWQSYWSFLAYSKAGSPKSSTAIDALRKSFAEHDADINLAESIYLLRCGHESHETDMMTKARETFSQIEVEQLSKPLLFIHEIMAEIFQNGIKADLAYKDEHNFALTVILKAHVFIEHVQKVAESKRQAEQQRLAEEERLRKVIEEQERRMAEEAEQARVAEQKRIVAEQEAKMKAEMQRLGVKEEGSGRDFVGYETTMPKEKKWGIGKILLVVLIAIVVLIGILFLIPAPDSMQ